MLIGLVRDSVLRCFCHTCSLNSAITEYQTQKKPFTKQKNSPKRKQPKKHRRYHATEIRCEEKSRGGMCYEVLLATPIADKPARMDVSPHGKSITCDGINLKLQQAEARRKVMETTKVTSIQGRLAKLEEATRKREMANSEFIICTKIALEEKFEVNNQNREDYLTCLRSKLAEHLNNIEQVKKQLDEQSANLNEIIMQKMTSAQENRDEYLRCLLDKLRNHDKHAKNVRLSQEEAIQEIKRKMDDKLNAAEKNRRTEHNRKMEVLRGQERRREMVKCNKMKMQGQSN